MERMEANLTGGEDHGRQTLEDMLGPAKPLPDAPSAEEQDEGRDEEPSVEASPSRRARLALTLAIVAIPAALVPILGAAIAVAAIVLAARERRASEARPTRGRAATAIAVAALAILVALGSAIFAVYKQDDKGKDDRGAVAGSTR